MNKQLLGYNIAFIVSIYLFQELSTYYNTFPMNDLVKSISYYAVTLFSFNFIFSIFQYLEKDVLWKYFGKIPNIEGMWIAEMKDEKGTKFSKVTIYQNKYNVKFLGRNYLINEDDFYSTWNSGFSSIEDYEITCNYDVTAKDKSYSHAGTSKVVVEGGGKRPNVLIGTYADLGKSKNAGTIKYKRVNS